MALVEELGLELVADAAAVRADRAGHGADTGMPSHRGRVLHMADRTFELCRLRSDRGPGRLVPPASASGEPAREHEERNRKQPSHRGIVAGCRSEGTRDNIRVPPGSLTP